MPCVVLAGDVSKSGGQQVKKEFKTILWSLPSTREKPYALNAGKQHWKHGLDGRNRSATRAAGPARSSRASRRVNNSEPFLSAALGQIQHPPRSRITLGQRKSGPGSLFTGAKLVGCSLFHRSRIVSCPIMFSIRNFGCRLLRS